MTRPPLRTTKNQRLTTPYTNLHCGPQSFRTGMDFADFLIRDPAGLRLAKRNDAPSIRALRASGLSPADICALF